MKRSLILAGTALFLAGCGDMLNKAGITESDDTTIPSVPTDTTIDAVSSASEKFKLNGGTIFDNSIEIDFWYKYDNGETWALILNENNDTVLCDTLNKAPYSYPAFQDNVHVIEPLEPGTNYRLVMDGFWYGDVWPLDTVEFTTRNEISGGNGSSSPLKIDGLTSASKKLKLNEATVYSDALEIDFWYMYDNGETWALLLDDSGDTVKCDTLNIEPYNYPELENNVHTMKPLEPGTEYQMIIEGFWYGDIWELDTITFTTPSN